MSEDMTIDPVDGVIVVGLVGLVWCLALGGVIILFLFGVVG